MHSATSIEAYNLLNCLILTAMNYSANLLEEALSRLYFDPVEHPENTLKAFQEFVQRFQLRFDALYPDPPKVLLEATIERWKIMEETQQNPSPKLTIEQFDQICEQAKARDKVTRFLTLKRLCPHQKRKQEKTFLGKRL